MWTASQKIWAWVLVGAVVALAAYLGLTAPVRAQSIVTICQQSGPGPSCIPITSTNPLYVTGTIAITGAASNASSAIVTSSTNIPTVAYNYGFNGTTWDQLRVGAGDATFALRITTASNDPIITALGSPFQAGGSIGNTTFAATQATASSLNATVVGTGTFAVQAAATATEVHVGEVGGNILPITNDLTTTNATTTTGQSIGGLQTLANAVRVSGSLGASGTSGMIQSVLVSFKDAVATSQIDVFYFNASPSGSTCTNDSAFILADADRDKVIGVAHVTDFTAGNTAVVAQAMNQAMPFGLASATSLFACIVARGSFAITGTANASLVTRVLRN